MGVDSRGPASIYLAADSRFTFESGATVRHEDGHRKVYASSVLPELLGFSGDVALPQAVIPAFLGQPFEGLDEPDDDGCPPRAAQLLGRLQSAYAGKSWLHRCGFSVLHALRSDEGMSSRFSLTQISLTAKREWRVVSKKVPRVSAVMAALGSGADGIVDREFHWTRQMGEPTSRAVFGAFCEELNSGADPYSGGAPELAGLTRRGNGREFGVLYQGGRYLGGAQRAEADLSGLPAGTEWFNEGFERCDPVTMKLLPGAQRQPKPRGGGGAVP